MIAQGVACRPCCGGYHAVEHRPEKLYRRWELRLCVCGDLYNCFHVLFCVATVKQVVHLLSCLLITLQICPCIGLNQGYNAGTAFAPVFNRLFNSRFGGKIMLGVNLILSNIIFCAKTRFLWFVTWVSVCGYSVFVYKN